MIDGPPVTTPSPEKSFVLPVGRLRLPASAIPNPFRTSSLRLRYGMAALAERRRSPTEVDLMGPSVPIARRLPPYCDAMSGTATVRSTQFHKPIPAIGVRVSRAATAL